MMKKTAYWVKNEVVWPDPRRVALESMKRDSCDSSYTKFRRLAQGVMVAAAGETVNPTTHREDRARENPQRTACCGQDPEVINDLLEELEAYRNRISNTEMVEVTGLMHELSPFTWPQPAEIEMNRDYLHARAS